MFNHGNGNETNFISSTYGLITGACVFSWHPSKQEKCENEQTRETEKPKEKPQYI